MPKAVIFDYDGTLINSVDDMYAGVCNVFKMEGKVPPTFDVFYREYGEPHLDFYRRFDITSSHEQIMRWYLQVANINDMPFFSDVHDVLEGLALRGILMGIISGNEEHRVVGSCRRAGLAHHMKVMVGQARDKVNYIRQFCVDHSVQPAETFYVGDFVSDVRDAKQAGVVAVGITRGRKGIIELEAAGAKHCISDLYEIISFLK